MAQFAQPTGFDMHYLHDMKSNMNDLKSDLKSDILDLKSGLKSMTKHTYESNGLSRSSSKMDLKNSLLSPGTPNQPMGMAVAPPTPTYLWIGCADSRLVPNQITGLPAGDIFIHRNVGNVVKSSDPNCTSTLEYAINCLKVKHIIVCGHYSCAAVQAAMKMQQVQLPGLLNFWIADIREAQNTHVDELKNLSGSQQLSRLCELNVIRQAFNVCTSPVVQAAWSKGQYLHIHAMIFDTKTGLLTRLAGPIASPVTDPANDTASMKDSPKHGASPAPSECSSSHATSSARLSRGSSRRRRMQTSIPKSVLAACKDSAEVEALHAMSRYLEMCGCVPDMENLMGLGAKVGGREDLAGTSKGLKDLEEKYSKMMHELEELKAAKNMAEDAQEHLTQQAQWLLKEKSDLVQRMGQREQLINNLQERLDFVQAECQQLRGGSPDALLEELAQMAAKDPTTLTPEIMAEMSILRSLASGEFAREVANSVCNFHPSPSHSTPPLATPRDTTSEAPIAATPDSIPAGKSLFARFLEDDQAVRAAADAVLSRADSAGPSHVATPQHTHTIPPSDCCSRSVTSAGLGEYRYLTLDDADRPSMKCPWTPSTSNTGSVATGSVRSEPSQTNGPTGVASAPHPPSARLPQSTFQSEDKVLAQLTAGAGEFAFDFQWDKASVRSDMPPGSTVAGSVAGTGVSERVAGNGGADDKAQDGLLTVSDMPTLPALKLPLPGSMTPMSVQGVSVAPSRPLRAGEAPPASTYPADSTTGPLTQRSIPASAVPSGYTTPKDGATDVGFGDDTWAVTTPLPCSPRSDAAEEAKPVLSLSHHRRRNMLQNVCDVVIDTLNKCGVDRWAQVPWVRKAGKPAAILLVGLICLAVPGPNRRRKTTPLPAPIPTPRTHPHPETLIHSSATPIPAAPSQSTTEATDRAPATDGLIPNPSTASTNPPATTTIGDTTPAHTHQSSLSSKNSALGAPALSSALSSQAASATLLDSEPTEPSSLSQRTLATFGGNHRGPSPDTPSSISPPDAGANSPSGEITITPAHESMSTDRSEFPSSDSAHPPTNISGNKSSSSQAGSKTSSSPWDTLQAGATDLVEQLEKRFETKLTLARPARRELRSVGDMDFGSLESWLVANGWDARWGCCEGAGGEGKVCVLRSARG